MSMTVGMKIALGAAGVGLAGALIDQANPAAGSPGACISRGGGPTYLYTNVHLA